MHITVTDKGVKSYLSVIWGDWLVQMCKMIPSIKIQMVTDTSEKCTEMNHLLYHMSLPGHFSNIDFLACEVMKLLCKSRHFML